MPRLPSFYRFKGKYFVTEAGGKGIHILCNIDQGEEKARALLAQWVEQCKGEKERAQKDGLVQTDSPFTNEEIAAEFLQFKEATRKANTVEFHQKNLQRFVAWYGHLEAGQLRLAHGTDYIARLKAEGLANVTINHHLRSAKSVLNYAVETDRLVKTPWKRLPLLPEQGRKRLVTDEEFEKLIKACDGSIAYHGLVSKEDNAQLMKDILRILRFTALRAGELRKLRWDHILWEESFIVIPASEQKTGTTAKTPEDRIVPILDEAKAILLARKQKCGHPSLVFPSITGAQWSDQQFSHRFSRLRKRAGLDEPDRNGEKIVATSLRHTRLTEAGTSERWATFTLMRFAGHTTPQMTKRYVHPDKDDLLRAAREGANRRQAKPGT
jgi:integrase